MRRVIVTFILILGTFLLQCTVFQSIPLIRTTPNLLLILTVSFGIMRGKKAGLLTGFVSGLFIDLFYSNLFGFYALIYMYIGYLNGFLCKVFFDEDVKIPMLLVAISDFGFNLLFYVIQFAFRMRFDFTAYLRYTIIPEVIYTVLLSIILYRVYFLINKKLLANELEEQQSPWLRK